MGRNAEAEKDFNEFWKPLVCDKRGRVRKNVLAKELFDYHRIMNSVSKVYTDLTGGRLSKPNYDADVVIAAATDYQNDLWEEVLADEKKLWQQEIAPEFKRIAEATQVLVDMHEKELTEATGNLDVAEAECRMLRTRISQLEDIVSGQTAGVEDVCYVSLGSGPKDGRPVRIETSRGLFRCLWNSEYDILCAAPIIENDQAMVPEEWKDTVLDAVKQLDKGAEDHAIIPYPPTA